MFVSVLYFQFELLMLRILQVLELSNVGLGYIHVCALCGMKKLLRLNMQLNQLKIPPELGQLKYTLEALRLTANEISSIDSDYFNGFKRLREVYLDNNRLKSVPCLTSLQATLQQLRLDYNYLQNMDGIYKSGVFMKLQLLTISSNNIASFNVSALLNMPNLSLFSLRRNNLTTLSDPRRYFKGRIKLSDNPWHCDPSISWMPSMRTLSTNIVCESPPCLLGNIIIYMGNTDNSQYVSVPL